MGTRIYVGNLPFQTTEEDLRLAFAQCGTVQDAAIIKDRETQRSRGFGFVTMSTEAEMRAAVERWNGQQFSGRALTVNEAQEKPRGGGYGGGGGGGGRYSSDPDRKGDGRGRGGRGRGNRYDDYG